MINALFYIYSKKLNSTAQPASGAVTIQVELKQDTDIINPVLLISAGTGITTPYNFNYCYIATFTRYYFINNWTWRKGIWECTLAVDVLASYKATLATASQYVLRSASASNGKVEDTYYPIINDIAVNEVSLTSAITRNVSYQISSGYYVVGIVSGEASIGVVTYYAFTIAEFNTFKQALFNDISWANVSDVSSDLLKTMFNPYDYIVSCKWFPVTNLASGLMAVTSIKLGWWSFTCNAHVFGASNLMYLSTTWSIAAATFPSHPQASRGVYLNGPNYTTYGLLIAPYGCIDLPSDGRYYGIYCQELIDYITGEAILHIYAGAGSDQTEVPLKTYETEIGVDIQLAQVRSVGGITGKGIDAIASGAGALINTMSDGVIKSALSGVASAVREQNTTVKTGGSNGGFGAIAQFGNSIILTAMFRKIANEDNSHMGRPLCETRILGNLSGYILCGDADVAIAGTEQENRTLNQFLNSGFYYE